MRIHFGHVSGGTTMYGDTQVIRALARSLRIQGHQIELETAHLLRCAAHTAWTGLAADAMRGSVDAGAASLRRTADLHFEAATALDHHAAEVDRRKHLIALIEHTVLDLADGARGRLHGFAGAVGSALGDPVEAFLDRFDPPPSGHKEWLSLHLPAGLPGLASLSTAAHGIMP